MKEEIQNIIDSLKYRQSKWPTKDDPQTKGYKDGLQTTIDLLTELLNRN